MAAIELPILLVYVTTINDEYGNPRRGWIAYRADGSAWAFVEHGYQGVSAIPDLWARVPVTAGINITPAYYRRLTRVLPSGATITSAAGERSTP